MANLDFHTDKTVLIVTELQQTYKEVTNMITALALAHKGKFLTSNFQEQIIMFDAEDAKHFLNELDKTVQIKINHDKCVPK